MAIIERPTTAPAVAGGAVVKYRLEGDAPSDIEVEGKNISLTNMRTGKSITTVVPCPTSLASRIRPRWRSTVFFTSANPRPVPLSLVVKNGLKIFSSSAAEIPGPLS